MPEDRGTDMAINFISMQMDLREKVHTMEEVGKALDSVESMMKGVFPQLLNSKVINIRVDGTTSTGKEKRRFPQSMRGL